MQKLIILDRDGVINQDSDEYIKSLDEFIPIDGSIKAISRLYHAGFSIVVATNQSGIARGLFTLDVLHSMHDKLQSLLAPLGARIQHFYFCPHGPHEQCLCRKPKPGLIQQAANDFFEPSSAIERQKQLSQSYVIGDSLRDLQAGMSAGARVALVKTGKGIKTWQDIQDNHKQHLSHIPVYNDLSDFTDHLLDNNH